MVASALGEIKEGREGEAKCRLRLGKSYGRRSDLYPFADAVEAMGLRRLGAADAAARAE